MSLTYFKRFRMEIPLDAGVIQPPELARPYRALPWCPSLLHAHAAAKYESFRFEIDANVFACLGDHSGCLRLMKEISHKEGFLPEATWLICHMDEDGVDHCGTIQGIRDSKGNGSIQNIGITPGHRGHGLGTALIARALAGFQQRGMTRASLEVTSQNTSAIRLYERLGFRRIKTVYKAVELVDL